MRLSALFVICLTSLYSQEAPDLATLLKQSTDSLKKHKSYKMSMEVTTDMSIANQPVKMVLKSDIAAINPDKIRIESNESMGGGATIVTASTPSPRPSTSSTGTSAMISSCMFSSAPIVEKNNAINGIARWVRRRIECGAVRVVRDAPHRGHGMRN